MIRHKKTALYDQSKEIGTSTIHYTTRNVSSLQFVHCLGIKV